MSANEHPVLSHANYLDQQGVETPRSGVPSRTCPSYEDVEVIV
jgi:hypothetical protein